MSISSSFKTTTLYMGVATSTSDGAPADRLNLSHNG